MIEKAYAELLLKIVFSDDIRIIASLGYPNESSYCRQHRSGYRGHHNVLLDIDVDLARLALHTLHMMHPSDYIRLRAFFRDGKNINKSRVNQSIRAFRWGIAAAENEIETGLYN